MNESNDSPVLVSAEAKAKRAARFGTTVESAEDKDKLLARAQRFGIPVSVDGKRSAADPEVALFFVPFITFLAFSWKLRRRLAPRDLDCLSKSLLLLSCYASPFPQ